MRKRSAKGWAHSGWGAEGRQGANVGWCLGWGAPEKGEMSGFSGLGKLAIASAMRHHREVFFADPAPLMPDQFQYQRMTVEENISVFQLTGVPSEADWLGAMKKAETWLLDNESRGQNDWGVIVDASSMKSIDAHMRRLMGEWRAKNMALIANTCLCGVYVAESAWLRGAITAVMWFARPVIPVSVKATRREALEWVRAKRRELAGY